MSAPRVPARYLTGIARYRDGDADDLRAFQERMFGPGARQLDRARQSWLFERNPCRSPDGIGLWVCRRDGVIVGQQAEIPFALSIGGVRRPAVWSIDLMVEDAWRIRGVGPGLVATQLAERSLAGGLNVSDKGKRTYDRAGWTDLGIVPVYVRPLAVGRAVRLAPVPPQLRRLAPMVDPPLRAFDRTLARAARWAGVALEPVERFDDRVDAVWAAAARDYPVLAVRDAATTRWRLDDRPDRHLLRRFLLTRRGSPLGYVALRPTSRAGDRAVAVVDYLAPVRWVAPLLALAAVAARDDGAVALLCKTRNPAADRSLRCAGFVRRSAVADPPIRFVFRCDEDVEGPEVARLVSDPDNWLVTAADSDLEQSTSPTPGAGGPDGAAGPDGPDGAAAGTEAVPT